MTPFEKLNSISNFEQYLNSDVSIEYLTTIKGEHNDVAVAILKE